MALISVETETLDSMDKEIAKSILIISESKLSLKSIYTDLELEWEDNFRNDFDVQFKEVLEKLDDYETDSENSQKKLKEIIEILAEYENIKLEVS